MNLELIMQQETLNIGNSKIDNSGKEIKGELLRFEKESFYKISNYDTMRPFFMSIVSDSDHWMFISSKGGLSAGRKNSESSLFPYYTDDKITESSEVTGNKTIIRILIKDETYLWEPFSDYYEGIYKVERNLYKNSFGNKVIFEEVNLDLGVTFRYQWNSSDTYGFVKKSMLINNSDTPLHIEFLDGLQNILPSGVSSALQNASSNLVDAYKRSELQSEVGLGIFALSAIIVDRAEPSEALKASIVWSAGLSKAKYLVSSLQLNNFRKGFTIEQETDVKAEKGGYFVNAQINLDAAENKEWITVANVNQSVSEVNEIIALLKSETDIEALLQKEIDEGTKNLVALNAASDGLQLSADKMRDARHFSNTLFNIMRGGIFDCNYQIEKNDFVKYLYNANIEVYQNAEKTLTTFNEFFDLGFLINTARKSNDLDFKRLCFEYLPLKFSRRHGDPSRPWNRFSINTKNEIDGSKILDYQGNWRDIFQNWEALAHSYPDFIDSMIHKFLNASTFEGYNPYRVTKDGFDWEVEDPHDPWAYIGYWGDHQIIYLLKFLEFIENHYPNKLAAYFSENIFVYANVPYKIKSYQEILRNPKDTIVFDQNLHDKIASLKAEKGADGALLLNIEGQVARATMMEKLLATVLAKLSNFIPEAGIWMNTQRPEWNDANNALVGNGVSMVTLYYLRRFLSFFENIVAKSETSNYEVSIELQEFFLAIYKTFESSQELLRNDISDSDRKTILDGLGNAGSEFRESVYSSGFSNNKISISKNEILDFVKISNSFLEHSIRANKRKDNLYHAYNLMTVSSSSTVSVSYLDEMLEGQVAVLSSKYLKSEEVLDVLNGLKNSALFRPDQYSYILYPNKQLPGFFEKNCIPEKRVKDSELLQKLLADKNLQIIQKDVEGTYHFNGSFNNANSLKEALEQLDSSLYGSLKSKDRELLLEIFEEVFNHKAFTGRSGTFYGYEGLGSIYWHMVSKLVLAIQETCLTAIETNADEVVLGKLLEHYYEANEGIGVHKSPELYGAFPTDPYSHTPGGKGAQQPGMTGQVKEDILSRFGELGIGVKNGRLYFDPRLLRRSELLKESKKFYFLNVKGEEQQLELDKKSLCFTYCQVPIIYKQSQDLGAKVYLTSGEVISYEYPVLDELVTKKMFERTGEVEKIEVSIN